MSHFFGAVALGVALITPAAVHAQDRPNSQEQRGAENQRDANQHQGSQDRAPYAVYDSKHRQWHEWNADEDKSYHQYLSEKHKQDQDFWKSSPREQQDYWNWRHKHSESH